MERKTWKAGAALGRGALLLLALALPLAGCTAEPAATAVGTGSSAAAEPLAAETPAPTAASIAQPAAWNTQSASEFVAQTLASLTVEQDSVHFALPQALPVDPLGKIQLYITLHLTYQEQAGVYGVDSPLDWAADWTGGQRYETPLRQGQELVRVMLRVAFMTDLGDGAFSEDTADSLTLNAPFSLGQAAGWSQPGLAVTQQEGAVTLAYQLGSGSLTASLALPQGAVPGGQQPGRDGSLPALELELPQGTGLVELYPYAAPDAAAQSAVELAGQELPMPIFGTTAVSNHLEYQDYQVAAASDGAAAAVCKLRWQDLSGPQDAASTPWQSADCVLAFDLASAPYYLSVSLPEGALTDAELKALAKSITLQ